MPDAGASEAAGLRALCESLLPHTRAADVEDLVTEQVPEPRSALACVLQMTDTDDGAHFWRQYATGAGQAAAYYLYLHHLALGEDVTARWWHRQTDHVQPQPSSLRPPANPLVPNGTQPSTGSPAPPPPRSCGSCATWRRTRFVREGPRSPTSWTTSPPLSPAVLKPALYRKTETFTKS